MVEIKLSKKKKNKKQGQKRKIENSKKLAWFSAMCFMVTVIYTMLIFTYGVMADKMCDFTVLITLLSVVGAVFGVTMVAYSNKSRYENVIKIQQSYLKFKYLILKTVNALDDDRVKQEVENELADIETNFSNEKNVANQEITYNQ